MDLFHVRVLLLTLHERREDAETGKEILLCYSKTHERHTLTRSSEPHAARLLDDDDDDGGDDVGLRVKERKKNSLKVKVKVQLRLMLSVVVSLSTGTNAKRVL